MSIPGKYILHAAIPLWLASEDGLERFEIEAEAVEVTIEGPGREEK
jgi:hypothetical protein